VYLVCIGQSTNENIRAVWDSVPNPYDQGCCYNYVGMCMQGVPQSRLQDMHEVMSEEDFLLNLGPAWARGGGGGGSAVSLGGVSSLGSLGGSQSALASAGASASSQRVGSPMTTPLSGAAAAAAAASAAAEAVGDTDERGRSPARVPEASNRPLSPLARLAAAMSPEKSVKKGTTTTTTTPLLSATSKHGSKDKGLSQYDR